MEILYCYKKKENENGKAYLGSMYVQVNARLHCKYSVVDVHSVTLKNLVAFVCTLTPFVAFVCTPSAVAFVCTLAPFVSFVCTLQYFRVYRESDLHILLSVLPVL